MKPLKVLFTTILLLSFSLSYAQKSTMEKANQLYKLQSYADAIPLFQKALSNKESLPGRTKLAYSLMMLNRMEEASLEYEQIVNAPRVRSGAYFQYGQVLMSLEKYGDAKQWFLKYDELEPDKEEGRLMAAACDKVQFIEPLFQYVHFNTYPYNTDLDDTAPVHYKDGIVFSSDRNPGIKFLKQKSAATGRDYVRLYYSAMNEDGSFKSPKSFSAKINELNKNVATAGFSADGTEVYFTKNGNTANRKNAYTMQLFMAKKNGGRWKGVESLPFCRPNYNYMHPCVSPDGKMLFFTTDKPSGEGGTDIYYSVRKGEKWGKARNMGSKVNTAMNEGFPFMNKDGKLYFCSKGHVGYGGYDIFVTEKDTAGEWQKPVNIGKPFNSSHDDVSIYILADSINGFFTSSREGGDDDIYLFQISDEPFEEVQNESTPVAALETAVNEKQNLESAGVPDESLVDTTSNVVSIEEQIPDEADILNSLAVEPSISDTIAKEVEIKTGSVEVAEVKDAIIQDTISEKEKKNDVEKKEDKEIFREKNGEINELAENEATRKPVENSQLLTFSQIKKHIKKGSLESGMYCQIDEVKYFPGEYLLDPSKTKYLEPFASLMQANPDLKMEIAAHTVSIGYDENNLKISKKRAKAIFNYMLYKDIPAERMNYVGFGEARLLNHCENGAVCSEEEHMVNQRVEVRVY